MVTSRIDGHYLWIMCVSCRILLICVLCTCELPASEAAAALRTADGGRGGIRMCNHCKWNESIFTCPDAHDYGSIACPSESEKCLKIIGNFTAWNDQTARYSVITGTQRVCLTSLSAQHLAIGDRSAGCRHNLSSDTTIGAWRFIFHGDYCICDSDNCNAAGIIRPPEGILLFSVLAVCSFLRSSYVVL